MSTKAERDAEIEAAVERRMFADSVRFDWDCAMGDFFDAVDEQRVQRGKTDDEAKQMLVYGYGSDIAEEWIEWAEQDR